MKTNWIEKRLLPIANKLQRNKYISAMQQTFMGLIPIMMIGSICIIITNPIRDYTLMAQTDALYGFFKSWALFLENYGEPITILSWTCLYSLGMWVAFTISYNLSRIYKMKTIIVPILSLLCFFVLCTTLTPDEGFDSSYWGGEGLFAALIIGILVTEAYRFLTEKKFGQINLPDTVPPVLKNSIGSLFPVIVIAALATTLCVILRATTGMIFPEVILGLISPIVAAVDNIFGLTFSSILTQITWWFGIHNSAVTSLLDPLTSANYIANAAAYSAGVIPAELPHIFTDMLWWNFMVIGGSGATFGLIFLMIKSKSKQIKTLGKLSFVPGLFGINEPIIFGLPIVLNPVFIIPWILAQTLNGIIAWICMDLNLVNKTFIDPSWNMPPIISHFIATLDWRAVVLAIALIVMDLLIYYPFFKAFEKQKIQEEAGELQQVGGESLV